MKTYQELSMEIKERDYAREYENYHSRPEQIARRSARNSARRIMRKKSTDEDLEGKDVHHKDNNPLNRREPRMRDKEEEGTEDG